MANTVPSSIYPLSHASHRQTTSTSTTPASKATYDILIYGATSFTAALTINYLLDHPQRSEFSFCLAGRNRQKLNKLAEDIEKRGYDAPDTLAFELDDEAEDVVRRAVEECKVVINLAGPYSSHNAEILIRQCAIQGRHYVDLTAETPWVKEMIEKYDFLASTTGSCIIPSCGFDSIPSDLTTYLSAQRLATTSSASSGRPNAQIVNSETYHWVRGGTSGGTIASGLAIAAMEKTRIKRAWGEFGLSMSEKGRASVGLRPTYYNALTGLRGILFFMAPPNTAVVRRSWSILQRGRILTSPTLEPSVQLPAEYGQDFTYDEAMSISPLGQPMGWGKTWVFGMILTAVSAAFAGSSLVRALVKLVAPGPGSGPSEEAQKKGYFEAVNVTQSQTDSVVTTMFGRYDPGYSGTARMLAESALCLSLSQSSVSHIGKHGGVLTPATAIGDILTERLRRYGLFEIETRSVAEWERERGTTKKDL